MRREWKKQNWVRLSSFVMEGNDRGKAFGFDGMNARGQRTFATRQPKGSDRRKAFYNAEHNLSA